MRVYELAKDLGLVSKDCVTLLKDAGFAVSSHMSVLSDGDIDKARDFLSKKPAAVAGTDKKAEPKQASSVAAQKKSEPVKAPVQVKRPEPQEKPASSVAPSKPTEKKPSMIESQKPTPVAAPKPVAKTPLMSNRDASPTLHGRPLEDMVPNLEVLEEVLAEVFPNKQEAKPGIKGQEKFTRIFSEKKSGRSFRRGRYRRYSHQEPEPELKAVTEFSVSGPMRLGDLAVALGKPVSEIILALLKKGMVCNINNIVPVDAIKSLAVQFGITLSVAEQQLTRTAEESANLKQHKVISQDGTQRYPIVVVMGHVDHGKTTLLDYVRKKNVASGEKGGITQHLGAYEVTTKHGHIVFLDTPGHEAFSYIRKQGSKITDIAILVIAADDGIKPQTIEAIKHAKEAEVPIIVAINKIDKAKSPSAVETIKRQLAQYDLMTEDWGGQVVCVPISAKTGEGVDHLLEMVILQSQLMDLKARQDVPARVFILESHVEKGFGPVATGITLEGVLKQGDYFLCGDASGKVRLLIDSHGQRVKEAKPGIPVQIVGFNNFAGIGEWLHVGKEQDHAKFMEMNAATEMSQNVTAQQDLVQQIGKQPNQKYINLIVKTDTRGSKEALTTSIEKLVRETKEINCPIRIVSSGIGDISEGDVELALGTNAYLVGLHVKVEKNAQVLAKDKDVQVHLHGVIYHLLEWLHGEVMKRKEIKSSWEKCAELVVRKVFDIKGTGVIAGCYVKEGVISKGYKVVCMRNGKAVGEAKINSLQRDKKTVKEVHAGFECGFVSDGYTEWQPDDIVAVYKEIKEA